MLSDPSVHIGTHQTLVNVDTLGFAFVTHVSKRQLGYMETLGRRRRRVRGRIEANAQTGLVKISGDLVVPENYEPVGFFVHQIHCTQKCWFGEWLRHYSKKESLLFNYYLGMACPSTEGSCASYCDGPSRLDPRPEGLWCVCEKLKMASCCTYAGAQNVWSDTEFYDWTDDRSAYVLGGWALAYIIVAFVCIVVSIALVIVAFHRKAESQSKNV